LSAKITIQDVNTADSYLINFRLFLDRVPYWLQLGYSHAGDVKKMPSKKMAMKDFFDFMSQPAYAAIQAHPPNVGPK
jgi:hypothetical protein